MPPISSDLCRPFEELSPRRVKKVFRNERLIQILVEPGGFEPPSASTPLSVLHA